MLKLWPDAAHCQRPPRMLPRRGARREERGNAPVVGSRQRAQFPLNGRRAPARKLVGKQRAKGARAATEMHDTGRSAGWLGANGHRRCGFKTHAEPVVTAWEAADWA